MATRRGEGFVFASEAAELRPLRSTGFSPQSSWAPSFLTFSPWVNPRPFSLVGAAVGGGQFNSNLVFSFKFNLVFTVISDNN